MIYYSYVKFVEKKSLKKIVANIRLFINKTI